MDGGNKGLMLIAVALIQTPARQISEGVVERRSLRQVLQCLKAKHV